MFIKKGHVIGGILNLRQYPDQGSTRLASIPDDYDLVLMYESTPPSWYRTIYSMSEGYVMADYIDIDSDAEYCEYVLGTSNLYNGCARSKFVVNLQTILTNDHFYTGDIDGYFGPLTENAVRAMQTAAGIAVDGIVGPVTRAALVPDY